MHVLTQVDLLSADVDLNQVLTLGQRTEFCNADRGGGGKVTTP